MYAAVPHDVQVSRTNRASSAVLRDGGCGQQHHRTRLRDRLPRHIVAAAARAQLPDPHEQYCCVMAW